MRKLYMVIYGIFLGSFIFANSTENLGIITYDDFAQVGVSEENVKKAKEIIDGSKNRYDYFVLDRRSKELEINKCILEGVEKNWEKISKLSEEIGIIEGKIIKERIKSQYEAQKYITQEQYLRARETAIRRIEDMRNKNSIGD